jgi:hypothetical protein
MRNSNIEPLSVVNEEPVSLIFTKDKAPSWFINIWSNQVTSGPFPRAAKVTFSNDKDGAYRFVVAGNAKLENLSFYKSSVALRKQRRNAIAEVERQIESKLAQGYVLDKDSRDLEGPAKKRQVAKLSKQATTQTVRKMSAWRQLKHWGTRYRAIDRQRFAKAATAIGKIYARHPDADYLRRKSSGKVPESFGDLIHEESESVALFKDMLLAKHSLEAKPVRLRLTGNVTGKDSDTLLIHGDLHVDGDLTLGNHNLLVTGDLVVMGCLQDFYEWTQLVVGGDIKAKRIDCRMQLHCAGTVKAPVIAVTANGRIHCQRAEARLFIEDGFDEPSQIASRKTTHDVVLREAPEKGVRKLAAILSAPLAAKLEKQWQRDGAAKFIFDREMLFKPLARGAEIFR